MLTVRPDPKLHKECAKWVLLSWKFICSETSCLRIIDTVVGFDHDAAMKELAGKPRQAEWEHGCKKYSECIYGTRP